jgi:hypothetical protein
MNFNHLSVDLWSSFHYPFGHAYKSIALREVDKNNVINITLRKKKSYLFSGLPIEKEGANNFSFPTSKPNSHYTSCRSVVFGRGSYKSREMHLEFYKGNKCKLIVFLWY